MPSRLANHARADNLVAEGIAGASDRVNLSGAVGYLDAKYTRSTDARRIDGAANRRFQNTPDLTASGTLAYHVPVKSAGATAAGTTLSYRSDSQQFELRTPFLDEPAYALLDANLIYTIDARFSIGVHRKNLTNKRCVVSDYNFLVQNPDTYEYLCTAAGALRAIARQLWRVDRPLRQPVSGLCETHRGFGSSSTRGAGDLPPFARA